MSRMPKPCHKHAKVHADVCSGKTTYQSHERQIEGTQKETDFHILHLAATVEALCARAHFLRVFPGSLMNPPTVKNCGPLHRDDFNRSCILLLRLLPTSCGHNEWRYFRHTWCSIGQSRAAPGHGMAERDAAGCPSRSVACPRAWVLNSVAKFVCCVQTLEGRLDEAEIAANFGLQKRCQG